MQILNRPLCQAPDCEEFAIVVFGKRWLCGKCALKAKQKLAEKMDELIFEEDGS